MCSRAALHWAGPLDKSFLHVQAAYACVHVLLTLLLLLPGPRSGVLRRSLAWARSTGPDSKYRTRSLVVTAATVPITRSTKNGYVVACFLGIVRRCRAGHSIVLSRDRTRCQAKGTLLSETLSGVLLRYVDISCPSGCRNMARGDRQPNRRAPHIDGCILRIVSAHAVIGSPL